MRMRHHLYGILERSPQASRLPSAGVEDAPVLVRRLGGLVVLSTLVDAAPRRSPYAVTRHREVQAAVAVPGPFFPMPYGVSVPSADLESWLAVRAGTIRAALRALRGRVEMRVSVLALRLGGVDAVRLCTVADQVAAATGIATWRSRTVGAGANLTISLAFLVPRADVAGVLSRIAPLASRAGDVAVVPSGPWPASSFVPSLDVPEFPAADVAGVRYAV
jgi:hypothetical protein